MKRENLKNEVCSVKYDHNLLFLGIGCTFIIVRRKTSKVIYKCDPFFPKSDKIFGIEKFGDKVLLFGGQCVQFFEYEFLEEREEKDDDIKITFGPQVFHFKDWIIKARLFKLENKLFLSILFAHNFLCTYDIETKQEHDLWCEEKCLLYSGEIVGESSNELTVFSGTVFKEILIWNNKLIGCKGAKILHRLKGHNGVIFSVQFDASSNFICSTSDDRSVRLWKVKPRTSKLVSEVGSRIDWSSAEICLQTTMFGHTARVWTLAIGQKTIVSIGEDSQICIWEPSGKLIQKIQAHNGAPIWSVDICEETKTIVTGAGDGSVHEWKIDLHFTETKLQQQVVELADKQKMPKHVRFLDQDIFLVLQEKSELCCIKKCGLEFRVLDRISLDERYWSYSLIAVSPLRCHVALASIDGFVTIYYYKKGCVDEGVSINRLIEGKLMFSKIFSIHFLDEQSLLLRGSDGCMKTFTFNKTGIDMEFEYTLPPSRERWVTAAVKQENILICGDRAGTIFVFAQNAQKLPVNTLYKVHSMGVQSCAFYQSKLVTTGRDGTIRFFNFRPNSDSILSEARKKLLPMWWVARILIKDKDLLVLGFNESDFVIFSTSLNRVLQRICCGGGHRSWDFHVTSSTLQFVFIREKKVYFRKINLDDFSIPPLMEGFHTKPILAVKTLLSTEKSTVFVSGSEDCSLKISRLENGQLKVLMSLDGHLSNIRCLDVLNFQGRKLVFSGGGRAQLKVWQVEFLSDEVTDVVDLASFMLKGTDKDRRRKLNAHNQEFDFDPETRFMDVKTFKRFEVVWVILACSDGFLRILHYDTKTRQISLKTEISHDFRCILKLHCLVRKDKEESGEITVLTMTTNGFVNFWRINEETFLKIGCLKLHQCGINCYDIKQVRDEVFDLATGGDDNLLKVTRIFVGKDEVKMVSTLENSSAHCAKIAGVQFLDKNRILSAGADEKVFLHEFNETEMRLLEGTFTTIPDVQGLTTFVQTTFETKWCIFGRGIETFSQMD